jgi:hypothetical protein
VSEKGRRWEKGKKLLGTKITRCHPIRPRPSAADSALPPCVHSWPPYGSLLFKYPRFLLLPFLQLASSRFFNNCLLLHTRSILYLVLFFPPDRTPADPASVRSRPNTDRPGPDQLPLGLSLSLSVKSIITIFFFFQKKKQKALFRSADEPLHMSIGLILFFFFQKGPKTGTRSTQDQIQPLHVT